MAELNLIELSQSLAGSAKDYASKKISLNDLLSQFIKTAEQVEGATGDIKKKAVIDALVGIYLNSPLNIKFVPDAIEEFVFRILVGMLIDTLVAKFNKTGW